MHSPTGWLLWVVTYHYILAIVRNEIRNYLLDMNNRNGSPEAMPYGNESGVATRTSRQGSAAAATNLMRLARQVTFAVLALGAISMAADLPDAPSNVINAAPMIEVAIPQQAPQTVNREATTIDKKFVALAIISTGSTFADSYTTLFARENWLAGKKGVCNEEVESAYLYGTHPTVGRTYAVASVKSAGSLLAAYYLRKHHSKFWSLPLVANSAISLQGVTQNMIVCN